MSAKGKMELLEKLGLARVGAMQGVGGPWAEFVAAAQEAIVVEICKGAGFVIGLHLAIEAGGAELTIRWNVPGRKCFKRMKLADEGCCWKAKLAVEFEKEEAA